jgi:predicted transcriptional regulator
MLKLMLVEDGRTLLELPLSARSWDRGELSTELEGMEDHLENMSELFRALSNAGRVRMMRALFESHERNMAFTELMNELGMNPKLVWDSTRKLRRSGLIEKDDDGRYRPTREGEAQFLMVSIAMRHMLQILREI